MIDKLLDFIEDCRREQQVAVVFVQPDGAYVMFPTSEEIMANKEADEAIGRLLVSLYRDGLASLNERSAGGFVFRKREPEQPS